MRNVEYFPPLYSRETAPRYVDFLKGKKVVVVGGGQCRGAEVERYDVVVRLNDHVLRQGGRCEVIYHTTRSAGLEERLLLQHSEIVPRFIWLNLVDGPWEAGLEPRRTYEYYAQTFADRGSQVGYFAQGEWMYDNPYGEEFEWLNTIHKRIGGKLLTGLVAVADIAMHPVASIDVVAMDLYINEAKRIPDYRDSHYLPAQIKFLEEMKADKRVTLCKPLLAAMAKYKQQFGDNHKRTIR